MLPRRDPARAGGGRSLTRIVSLDVGSSSVRAVAYGETGVAEPGDAHLAYNSLAADELVAACRSVLAQVGEGDVLAVSCFWHSLVAVDGRDRPLTPVLTWRDVAGRPPPLDPVDYHHRTGCFLHPAYWPAKLTRLGDMLGLRLPPSIRQATSPSSPREVSAIQVCQTRPATVYLLLPTATPGKSRG